MYHNPTGLPSVTQVIRPYIDTDWFLPEHAVRGIAVHGAMKAHLLGAWSPPLKPEHQPYFDSGRKWASLMVDEVFWVERRLVDSANRYSGQPDLLCRIKGDGLLEKSLVDWKTSQQKVNWHPIQIAAYRVMIPEMTHRGMTVRLMADGSMAQMDEHPPDVSRYFNIFVGLLNAWNYFNK